MKSFKKTPVAALVMLALAGVSSAVRADTVNLGTVGGASGATSNENIYAEKGTASAVAPTQANLTATEPQSVISRSFIEEMTPPTGNLNTIISIAPSMASSVSPNGPGLMDTKTTMRGFSETQFNMTFDGVPFGDTNDQSHHSTSYFPASIIGGAVIERGPGNASNIGYKTYGGSVNLFSKTPSETQKTSISTSFGTWNTSLIAISHETGRMKDSDATLQLDAQQLKSDGYMTYAKIDGTTLSGKYQRPVADSSLLTLYSAYSHVKTNQPDAVTGSTLLQQNTLGRNYYLNNNPLSQGYYKYNLQDKETDFEYARLQTQWGEGWNTDNTFYTYRYWNKTTAGADPGQFNGTTDTAYTVKKVINTTSAATIVPVGDVPGYYKLNGFRVWGNNFKATKKMGEDTLRVGLWYEMNQTNRHNLEADLTTGSILPGVTSNASGLVQPGVVTTSNFAEQWSQFHSTQPYVEYEWTAAPGLKVTPGLKYMSLSSNVSSLMNQKSQLNQTYTYKTNATLPFLTANQQLDTHNAVYAQWAKGVQVPTDVYLSGLNSTINGSQPAPQYTTNYQVGWIHKTDRLVFDADLYYIDVNNLYINTSNSNTNPVYINAGGAIYSGFEGQVTYAIDKQWSVYANLSKNRADFKSGNASITGASSANIIGQVPNAPLITDAVGVMYSDGVWASSLLYKNVGSVLSSVSGVGNLPSYDNLDWNLSYTIKDMSRLSMNTMRIQFSAFNLLNKQAMIYASAASASTTTYQWQAPRSYMLTLKAEL
jgi:iron complex outermembrane receptor protein